MIGLQLAASKTIATPDANALHPPAVHRPMCCKRHANAAPGLSLGAPRWLSTTDGAWAAESCGTAGGRLAETQWLCVCPREYRLVERASRLTVAEGERACVQKRHCLASSSPERVSN